MSVSYIATYKETWVELDGRWEPGGAYESLPDFLRALLRCRCPGDPEHAEASLYAGCQIHGFLRSGSFEPASGPSFGRILPDHDPEFLRVEKEFLKLPSPFPDWEDCPWRPQLREWLGEKVLYEILSEARVLPVQVDISGDAFFAHLQLSIDRADRQIEELRARTLRPQAPSYRADLWKRYEEAAEHKARLLLLGLERSEEL